MREKIQYVGKQCPKEPQGTTTMQVQIVQCHYSTHNITR